MRAMLQGLVYFAIVAAVFAGGLEFAAWLVRPDLAPRPPAYTEEQVKAAEQSRDVSFDPKKADEAALHVDKLVAPKGESPILASLVKEGKLPPLAERMPKEPTVLRGVDGIGNYGGTWMRVAVSQGDADIATNRLAGATLMRWSPLGYPLKPHIAKSVEPSPDRRQWTITLREGLRWSDGHPYTADDIMYWWECEANNKEIMRTPPSWMRQAGKYGTVEKLSAYQVRFTFPEPHGTFMETLAQVRELCELPAHYVRQFHPDPKIGNKGVVEREMKAYKLPSYRSVYGYMKSWGNPEHPRLWPWIYRTSKANPPQIFVRNPYYYVVDLEGNQLPYIDRLQFELQDAKMLALTAANGGVSMQARNIRYQDYTELMSRRETAGTEIYHWNSAVRSVYVINPNLNRRVEPGDPSTKNRAELLADRKFRQALSVAIHRQRIIDADYNGYGEPSQVAPGPGSVFHHEGVAKAYTQYDPALANKWLDELGLTKRDSEGMRTFGDGSRMTFYLDFTAFTGIGPAQFVVDDWKVVGVRVITRERSRPLFYAEKAAYNVDFNVWSGESDSVPLISPRYFIPFNTESCYAVGWGKWYERGGFYGLETAKAGGCIPVPEDSPMYEAIACYEKALRATDVTQQKAFMNRVMDIAAENTWSISIATPPPQLVVVKKGFKNVPRNALFGYVFYTPANAGIETYFFETPNDSPGAIADTKHAITTPTLRVGAPAKTPPTFGSYVSSVLRYAFIGIVVLSVILIAVRAPYIGRRLTIMIPTLVIISLVVFTIIQLPPGDYLSTRLMQLQESGDVMDLRAIEDLRQQFRFDDPMWMQYSRWLGLNWFVTFDSRDLGLLQGNMGRSMETNQLVNNMVGDRITLTVLLSLGTILFTWALALPIGIYSAVKQYTLSDYLLTLFGFIGMCVPAFLLALVLMAVAGVSGLFSPQYAAQPEWSTGKILDLVKHIWIPIVVLGIGGTAGMIRIMRANLLDELRKPYVVTAMAKGVRPMRLLLKYPVRLALNPFISGIGGIFPGLVSGGAIVSIVLALPMVGPLLLTALQSEDIYMAGSMLMVLSTLSVLGTLVSDLLLLWLDPRIRYEGGSR